MKLLHSDFNPVTGVTTEYWLHANNSSITVRGVQDAEPMINANTAELNSKSAKASKLNERDGLGTKVASIPMGLVDQLNAEDGINILTCSEAELKRLLNDPEYAKLRTSHGRV